MTATDDGTEMDYGQQPSADLQRIRDAFSAAWQAGARVTIGPFLAAVSPPHRPQLFRELLVAEISHRRQRGEAPTADEYRESFPDLLAIIEELLPATGEPADQAQGLATPLTDTVTREDPHPVLLPSELPQVPGYELHRIVGQGGMGVVYDALHKATQRRVAVKMVVPTQTADETQARLFLREATTLSQLDHRRIVKFHEVGIVAGQLYLVMEYVDTIDLDEILVRREEPRTVRLLCGFICQVLEALAYAHRLGFVHRDVKPSNVLVCRQDGKYRTKLADFGLAKNFETAGFSSVTTMGECRGTIGYMAPEQLKTPQWSQPTADLFSVTATLYDFLSGASPYDFTGSPNPFMAVMECRINPLDPLRPDLPRPLLELVRQGLAPRPEDRFPSAVAMRHQLLRFATGRAP